MTLPLAPASPQPLNPPLPILRSSRLFTYFFSSDSQALSCLQIWNAPRLSPRTTFHGGCFLSSEEAGRLGGCLTSLCWEESSNPYTPAAPLWGAHIIQAKRLKRPPRGPDGASQVFSEWHRTDGSLSLDFTYWVQKDLGACPLQSILCFQTCSWSAPGPQEILL